MPHPFHIHGHKFVVLKMGFAEQYYDNGTIKGLNQHLECLGKVINFITILKIIKLNLKNK
jgi:hypothetical protein